MHCFALEDLVLKWSVVYCYAPIYLQSSPGQTVGLSDGWHQEWAGEVCNTAAGVLLHFTELHYRAGEVCSAMAGAGAGALHFTTQHGIL